MVIGVTDNLVSGGLGPLVSYAASPASEERRPGAARQVVLVPNSGHVGGEPSLTGLE
jgi:hypothetical protein